MEFRVQGLGFVGRRQRDSLSAHNPLNPKQRHGDLYHDAGQVYMLSTSGKLCLWLKLAEDGTFLPCLLHPKAV